MELLGSPTSPYVRKCRVVAHETGQADTLKISFLELTPVAPNNEVNTQNPLGKVPVLVLDGAPALFDSRVISEYLDTLHDGAPVFPDVDSDRWKALRLQSLGDGIMDAAVFTRFYKAAAPEEYHWPEFLGGQIDKVNRALSTLDSETAGLRLEATIGTIAVACALGYLDFRYEGTLDWRAGRKTLAHWYEMFSTRASMTATKHYQP